MTGCPEWNRDEQGQCLDHPVTAVDAALLDAVEQAHAAATPGPWELDPVALFASNDTGDLLFDYRDVVLVGDHPEGVRQCTADGELIVAAVNAAPALIRAARERDALRTAVLALADQLAREADERADSVMPIAIGERSGLGMAVTRLRVVVEAATPDA